MYRRTVADERRFFAVPGFAVAGTDGVDILEPDKTGKRSEVRVQSYGAHRRRLPRAGKVATPGQGLGSDGGRYS